ncbi:hypothetical protein [Streptomyces sp. NPDC002785]|uniref:hypothetical protein n=1 Tax=Streptomyces sp. NPDC002785 TaxID=3154543 RepID=UPI0033337DD9
MRTNKVFAVLCSALFAGSLAFVPAVTSQASAAARPAQQAVAAHDAVFDRYQDGYRQGFRDGYADARDDCYRGSGFQSRSYREVDVRWAQGYADGYDEGYGRSFDRFC